MITNDQRSPRTGAGHGAGAENEGMCWGRSEMERRKDNSGAKAVNALSQAPLDCTKCVLSQNC